jgi:hypothetical protein
MKQNKKLLVGYRLLFGLLGLSAIITEITTLVGRDRFSPANFFSYFTVETNIVVAVVLLLSAAATVLGKNAKLDALRSAVAAYILIVGVGFSVLLAGLENAEFTAVPWDNIVLHYIMPVAVLIDLIIDRPTRGQPFKQALIWLLFPVAYIAYSLIRGANVGWYPYPFLNPNLKGYGTVGIAIVGLLALSLGIIWVVCRISESKSVTQQPAK